MIFDYKGHKIHIQDRYVEDFEKYNGYRFAEEDIDICLYNRYIWDPAREHEIPLLTERLSDGEIEETVDKALKLVLKGYTRDTCYGE